jgi:ATP-binding cassette subfamily C protein CydCD
MTRLLTNDEPAVRAAPQRSPGLWGLIPLVAARKILLATTVLSGIVAQAGTVASLAAGAWLVGDAISGTAPSALVPSMLLLAVLVAATAAARWWQMYMSHDLAFAMIEILQVGIYDGLERAAPGYILGRRTGELAGVATADAELMEFFYAHTLGDYFGAAVVPVGALIALYFVHPLVALVLLPFLPLLASVPFWLARRAGEQGHALLSALGALNADVVEGLQGQRELAIFGHGPAYLKRLAKGTKAVAAEQFRYGSRSGLEQAAIDVLMALAVLAVALLGIVLVSRGDVVPSQFPLTLVLAGASLGPITEVTQTARKLGQLRAGAARILTIFHQTPQIADRGRSPAPADASIRFEHVGFSYDGERGAVLHDIDFAVSPGEMVALVGRSGAGKSTCANLLLRFWDAGTGAVRIGGIDVRDLPLAAMRRLVATVPQDVHLFNESVADNIRLGRPGASRAEIEDAARVAQAHDFIQALPQGYDTICGERGVRLSGGQRQRIAIARAFLQGAPILILDEAVSNLDTENERALQIAFAELRRDRTVLVIAHRLSTIRSADRILVLEDGRIVEEGGHDDLLARDGAYARLVAVRNAVA